MREFFEPTPEEQNVVLIDSDILHQAEDLVAGCEACSADDAEIPFEVVLDTLSGNDPAVTDYNSKSLPNVPSASARSWRTPWWSWRRNPATARFAGLLLSNR